MASCVPLRNVASMANGDRDWRHLGFCLRAARAGRSREAIAEEVGISESQLKRYEAGLVKTPDPPDMLWKLTNYYGWSPSDVIKMLRGEDPPAPRRAAQGVPPEIVAQIAAAITDGETLSDVARQVLLGWLDAQKSP